MLSDGDEALANNVYIKRPVRPPSASRHGAALYCGGRARRATSTTAASTETAILPPDRNPSPFLQDPPAVQPLSLSISRPCPRSSFVMLGLVACILRTYASLLYMRIRTADGSCVDF